MTIRPGPAAVALGPEPVWRVGVAHPIVVVEGRCARVTHVVALSVRIVADRPDGLPGALAAPAVPVRSPSEATATSRAHAERFVTSVLGRSPTHRIVAGMFDGPSAGLAFALALVEADLGPLAGSRVVAATGAITPWGLVRPVGEVELKAAGAEMAEADLLVVARHDADAAATWGRELIDLSGLDLSLAVGAARRAGRHWDGRPVVLAVHHAQTAGAFLCGATGSTAACALAEAHVPQAGPLVPEPLLRGR
ncbi:MAG TPA: S16 family serine protease [Acidimicrobiales bacterium]|nr:S16 family serine protease [Acidimicrobiales bacterium]